MQKRDENELNINEQITASQVRLVGENIPEQGVYPIAKARQLADELELDLVEISGPAAKNDRGVKMTARERQAEIDRLEKEMRKAAQMLEYEYAAVLRDQLIKLRGEK